MIDIEVDEYSRIPKYKQIVSFIINQIEHGKISFGDRIPSINQTSEYNYLSRDTVEKAYNLLKKRNIISSVKGKGYFVTNTDVSTKYTVCLLFNKLSAYKKIIYNSIISNLGDKAYVDLYIHHCNPKVFKSLVNKKLNDYSHFVIMPHFHQFGKEMLQVIDQIPEEKLIVLDKMVDGLEGEYGCIYQDFKNNIYEAFLSVASLFEKYEKLILVFPDDKEYPYPADIELGFRKFCVEVKKKFEIIHEFKDGRVVQKREAYVVIDENDLVSIVKQCRIKKYKLGKDVGLVSYNDTPLKEILAEGITVITTDFQEMGKKTAEMILSDKYEKVQNPFRIIKRQTL